MYILHDFAKTVLQSFKRNSYMYSTKETDWATIPIISFLIPCLELRGSQHWWDFCTHFFLQVVTFWPQIKYSFQTQAFPSTGENEIYCNSQTMQHTCMKAAPHKFRKKWKKERLQWAALVYKPQTPHSHLHLDCSTQRTYNGRQLESCLWKELFQSSQHLPSIFLIDILYYTFLLKMDTDSLTL